MTRRGLFHALAGISAAPAAVAAASTEAKAPESYLEYLWDARKPITPPLSAEAIDRIIHMAACKIGVLGPGERLPKVQFEYVQDVLQHLLEAWASAGFTPRNERAICQMLALDLAPEYPDSVRRSWPAL